MRDAREAHVALRHSGENLGGNRTQARGEFPVAFRLAVERGRKMLHEDGRVRDERRLETSSNRVLELHAFANGRIEPAVRELFERGRLVDLVGLQKRCAGKPCFEGIGHALSLTRLEQRQVFKFMERHGFVHVKFRLAARRSYGGCPERKKVSAALEQTVGRIEHGRALGRTRTFLLDLFNLHPQRGKTAAVLREHGHRRAQTVFGRYQAVVFVRADFLRVGRRLVVKILHAREHRLVLASVRRPIDKKRQGRYM